MITGKRDKVEKIGEIEELIGVTENILKNTGYEGIERLNKNLLSASFSIPGGGVFTNLYVHCLVRLSRNSPELAEISTQIRSRLGARYAKIVIISNYNITNGFQQAIKNTIKEVEIDFWSISELVDKIDSSYSIFWNHSDNQLVQYEKEFQDSLNEVNDLKKIVAYKKSHEKLLAIFIKPKLYLKTKDKQSSRPGFKKQGLRDLMSYEGLIMINGEAGSGKSRLLKELSFLFIESNATTNEKKVLPIYVYASNINDYRSEENIVDLRMCILDNLKESFGDTSFEEILSQYQLVLFIDTIDEFDDDIQNSIFKSFDELIRNDIRVFLGTRNITIESLPVDRNYKISELHLSKFDTDQIEKFLRKYFFQNESKAADLLQSIKDNKIIEKLPITPLNLSLLSLLYEENNYEVPSTITDIYTSFSNLLLGRTTVDERYKFLDITVKESILSSYALKLLGLPNNRYLTITEFYDYIKGEFSSISGTIDLNQLEGALEFLIKNTGFLVLYENRYVKFRHDSYMEFFAAKEIFQNQRDKEDLLINNFLDVNWQFAAIFYAGFSRRMPSFLEKVTEVVTSASTFKEYISGVGGIGYLTQALYLTDDSKRKDAILVALLKVVEAYDLAKKLSADKTFKILEKYTIPIIALFNSFLFFENFNSITIKQPLVLAFDELFIELQEKERTNSPYTISTGFKLFAIAWTLSSSRIQQPDQLAKLVYDTQLLNNSFFELLFDIALGFSSRPEIQELRGELERIRSKKKSKKSSNHFLTSNVADYYLTTPTSRIRFSKYDVLIPEKKYKLITEGITDSIIIQHAYLALTKRVPYWEIRPSDPSNGGANELAKIINNCLPTLNEEDSLIGIFDNDSKGIQEFNGGLRDAKFDRLNVSESGLCRVKKHKQGEVYGMLLPIPPDMQNYIFTEQQYNLFAIEHYFSLGFLEKHNMIEEAVVSGTYKIRDKKSNKKKFAGMVTKENSPIVFENFIFLFREIDNLFGKQDEIEYLV